MRLFLRGIPDFATRSREASFLARRAAAEAVLATAEVLILGNSHLQGGLPEEAWSVPALNLAFGAQDAWYDVSLLERFAPRMPRLRAVVLACEPMTPGYRLSDLASERGQVYDYAAVFGIPSDEPLVGPLRPLLARSRFLRYHEHLLKFFQKWATGGTLADAAGAAGTEGVSVGSPEGASPGGFATHGAERARYHFGRLARAAAVPANVRRLQEAAAFCRARRLSLLLVAPPFHRSYLERIPPEAALRFAAFLERLRAANDASLDHLDATRLFADDAALFRDPDHLNGEGARRFTRLVEERLFPR